MFLFTRPPVLRWVAVALALAAAMYLDLRPEAKIAHPFAARDLTIGRPLDPSAIVLRDVPPGMLQPLDLEDLKGSALGRSVAVGDPILASDLESPVDAPPGSFRVQMRLPGSTAIGDPVLIVFVSEPIDPVDGVVTSISVDDYGETTGAVAVPAARAADVARAAAVDDAIVVVGD